MKNQTINALDTSSAQQLRCGCRPPSGARILESARGHSVEAGDRSGALIGMLRSLTIGDDAGRTSCSRTGSNNRGERRPVLYPGNPLGISNEGTDNELHQTDMLSGSLH